MPSDETSSTENQPAPLSERSKLARLAGIGVVILSVVGGFLYLGGWFSPYELTQARFVNGFQKVYGWWSGFRRNHAKGVCVTGFFDGNGQGTRLSKAVVFQTGRVKTRAQSTHSTGAGAGRRADVNRRPHTRGWTPSKDQLESMFSGSPAHAGMDP